jgi:hypothetical protein
MGFRIILRKFMVRADVLSDEAQRADADFRPDFLTAFAAEGLMKSFAGFLSAAGKEVVKAGDILIPREKDAPVTDDNSFGGIAEARHGSPFNVKDAIVDRFTAITRR